MNKRHTAIFPQNYATLLTRAVDVPIYLAGGLKFWVTFYGLTSRELEPEHIRIAMERRGIDPGQYRVATSAQKFVQEAA